MFLNAACLADRSQERSLEILLDEFRRRDGYAVRFAGPWPPYTFAGT
jgi:hypothetical protein